MSEGKVMHVLGEFQQNGLSITDIVRMTSLSRSFVRITLARLEGAGKVVVRKVGMAKLYYLLK